MGSQEVFTESMAKERGRVVGERESSARNTTCSHVTGMHVDKTHTLRTGLCSSMQPEALLILENHSMHRRLCMAATHSMKYCLPCMHVV